MKKDIRDYFEFFIAVSIIVYIILSITLLFVNSTIIAGGNNKQLIALCSNYENASRLRKIFPAFEAGCWLGSSSE